MTTLTTAFGTNFFGSVVDVINGALLEIGAQTVVDPNEASPQAVTALTLYPRVVRAELRRHAWSFAMARFSLAELSTPPAFGYKHQYQLPSNFIRLWMIGVNYVDPILNDYVGSDASAFAIEGQKILTDETAPLPIRCITDVQNTPNLWDPLFFETVCIRLGLKLVPSTVKSDSKYQLMGKEYESIIKTAKRLNAIELPPTPQTDSSWDIARI